MALKAGRTTPLLMTWETHSRSLRLVRSLIRSSGVSFDDNLR